MLTSPHSYGLKGMVIVMHILLQLFRCNTPTDAFHPLPLMHYMCYFMVPHVIMHLICQDYNTSVLMNGYNIMEASSDVGELINLEHDDDSKLNYINQKTIIMFQGTLESSKQTQIEAIDAAVAKALFFESQGRSSGVMVCSIELIDMTDCSTIPEATMGLAKATTCCASAVDAHARRGKWLGADQASGL